MSKYSIPKQIIGKTTTDITNIKVLELPENRPIVSFEFIDGMSGGCLENLYKVQRSKTKYKLKELQKFVNEFSSNENLESAISTYSGKSQGVKNGYTKKIVKQLHKNHPKLSGINEDELMHIHAKRNGKGETVYFGFRYENIFNIIYIDSQHDFNK